MKESQLPAARVSGETYRWLGCTKDWKLKQPNPLQWKYGNTPTVEMRSIVEIKSFGIKNPAQGFRSLINNCVFYRCDVAVSDYNNINNKITKITDVAVVLR